jgi:hypothetical protein
MIRSPGAIKSADIANQNNTHETIKEMRASEKWRFVSPEENTMVATEKDSVDCYGV